ncbi:putative acyltransferase [Paenibacillus mucilaginosus 3016]|uniref:Putative acyltransferase n=1 Tax=Paenibacillus mucilaginosus 3016 TaxID=1116391 RepID=H6NTQ5_9BACL|nr:putative acyltransferase [Paenibacillus mucilaginosus 3016]
MVNIQPIRKEQAWQLRHEVMWPDKDYDYVKLADDDEGAHYGLFEGAELLSVVSLFVRGGEAQFRKFATSASRQKMGYGSRLLTHVLGEAERAGVKRIYCNARVEKAGFYEKFGLSPTEDTFTKSGKTYVVMERYFG